MTREGGLPTLVDLYSGCGGASRGYQLAGFEVMGVDLVHSPRYCGDRFMQMDAIEYVGRCLAGEYPMPDAWAASPPCQAFTPLKALSPTKAYPDLVAATRAALEATGRPYAIENVVQAPLSGITLCGAMFGLRVYRHRRFESNVLLLAPPHPKHTEPVAWGRDRKRRYEAGWFISITGDVGSYCGPAMEIGWMNGNELSQAIPPAFTRHVGGFLRGALSLEVA